MKKLKLKFTLLRLTVLLVVSPLGQAIHASDALTSGSSDNDLLLQQGITVTGKVISADDEPLPGVNITIKGTTNGTITNIDGGYSIVVPNKESVIQFSFIGYLTEEVTVGDQAVINMILVEDITQINEVVVTALGIEREKKALGYSAQELEGAELSSAKDVSITNFLTGKVAGVQITKPSSGTGGSSNIIIRGNSSLSGSNQPLIVVDGVPIINEGNTNGGLWGDNDYGDGISDINSEDVESMTVLKGPNASALYGSRGANGVILITTKSGKRRKGIGVEINSNVTIEPIYLFPKFQNSYSTGYEETNLGGSLVEIDGKQYETVEGWHQDQWGPPLDGRRTVVDPFVMPGDEPRTRVLLPQPADNAKDFYNVGMFTANTVAITGGADKTIARLSVGDTRGKGILPHHKYSKQTISLRANSQVTDFLSFDTKFNYIHDEAEQRPNLGSHDDNVFRWLTQMGRYVPMDFLKEYYETTGEKGRFPGIIYNPYYMVNELKNHDYTDRLIGFIQGNLQFTDWLSLMGRVGTDFSSEFREKDWPVGSRRAENQNGRVTTDNYRRKDINADVILTANKQLSEKFSATASVGASYLNQRRDRMFIDARNFKVEGVYHVSNAQDLRPTTDLWQKEQQSVFFTGQLAYNNYLFVDVTGRNDWSSALGRNNYSFFYPSVATSFVLTDAFDLKSNLLSFAKVRASWAQVGNDSEPYRTKIGYNSYTIDYNGQSFASKNGTIPLYDLKNELTESWEVGADLRFFNNRLSIDATYYNGKTTNQIISIPISSASGYGSVVINAGRIDNSGIEAVLNATPVKTGNGFRWDVAFNYAKNQSEVVELAPDIETFLVAEYYPNNIEARPGEPFGNIIGYAYRRAPDGQLIVGSGGNYEVEDKTSVLGNITPDWTGGLNNKFSYKGLSLSCLFDFVQGGDLSSATMYLMTARGSAIWTTEGRRVQDTDEQGNQLPLVGVLPGVVEIKDANGNVTGYEPNTQAVNGQTYWATRSWSDIGEEFVLDGSYVMLREVMLSYSIKPSLLQKMPFSGVTLTLVGRNLLYLGVDERLKQMGVSPESKPNTGAGYGGIESFSQPYTRSFGVNVKLTF
jgi:TonB-linked SusC/RagA family outer membrane protein